MKKIEVIARAVIIKSEKILLCKAKGHQNFYLPGGHVEFDEDTELALKRELKEELNASIKEMHFIGVNENHYSNDINHHEYNIVFNVKLNESNLMSQEDHIVFHWLPLNELEDKNILPKELLNSAKKWLEDKQPFWSH